MVELRKNQTRELEFREWVDYLKSANESLDELNVLSRKAYNTGNVEDLRNFCIALKVYIHSRSPYIHDKTIKKKVNTVADAIFSKAFVKDISQSKPNAIEYQYKALASLLEYYERVVICLSQNKIIPEITIREEDRVDEDAEGASV